MPTIPALLRRGLGAGLLLAGLAGAPAAHGQAGKLTVSVGYGPARPKWPTLNQFFDSYARANAAALTDKPVLSGGSVRSVLADGLGFGCIGIQQLSANATARFNTGAERTFHVQQNLFVVAVEPSLQTKNIFLGAVLGFHAGTVRVGSSYHYADGTRSWGADRALNGDYGGITLGGYYGAKLGVSWKALAVTARVEYFTKSIAQEDLSDKSNAKNTTANAFGGVGSPDFLPLDYEAYLAAPFEYSSVDHSVASDLKGLRAQLQVGLLLFSPRYRLMKPFRFSPVAGALLLSLLLGACTKTDVLNAHQAGAWHIRRLTVTSTPAGATAPVVRVLNNPGDVAFTDLAGDDGYVLVYADSLLPSHCLLPRL